MNSEQDPPIPSPAPEHGAIPGEGEVLDPVTGKIRKRTPEEQMARYEEALKEDDWGHQPC